MISFESTRQHETDVITTTLVYNTVEFGLRESKISNHNITEAIFIIPSTAHDFFHINKREEEMANVLNERS